MDKKVFYTMFFKPIDKSHNIGTIYWTRVINLDEYNKEVVLNKFHLDTIGHESKTGKIPTFDSLRELFIYLIEDGGDNIDALEYKLIKAVEI